MSFSGSGRGAGGCFVANEMGVIGEVYLRRRSGRLSSVRGSVLKY